MRVETFSESYSGKSGIAGRMDSRAKLVFALACLALVVASASVLVPLLAGAFCLALTLSSGVRLRSVALRMSEPFFFAFLLALFQIFVTAGGPIWGITAFGHNMPVSLAGLHRGSLILARVFGGVSVVLFLTMTTPAHRLLSAAARVKLPRGLVELSLFTYRYVFVLMEDALTVYHAQRGRLGYSGFSRGIKSLATLSGSVFLRAYAQAEATGAAMSMRGYTGEYIPVYRESLRAADAALLCLMFTPCLAAYLWTL